MAAARSRRRPSANHPPSSIQKTHKARLSLVLCGRFFRQKKTTPVIGRSLKKYRTTISRHYRGMWYVGMPVVREGNMCTYSCTFSIVHRQRCRAECSTLKPTYSTCSLGSVKDKLMRNLPSVESRMTNRVHTREERDNFPGILLRSVCACTYNVLQL